MGDVHDKRARAIWDSIATSHLKSMDQRIDELACNLRRIAEEEEEEQPASEGDGPAYHNFTDAMMAFCRGLNISDPVYRRAHDVLKRYRPPCTCNVEAAVREAVRLERGRIVTRLIESISSENGGCVCLTKALQVVHESARGASR